MKSSCLIFIALALSLLLAGCAMTPSQPPVTVVVTVVAPTPDDASLLTGVSPLPLPDWPEGHAESYTEGSNPFQVSVDDVETLTETVVIEDNLGKGPFRWLIYQSKDDRLFARSESFYLPSGGRTVIIAARMRKRG